MTVRNAWCNDEDIALLKRFRVPVGARGVSVFQNLQTSTGTHPESHSVGAEEFFPGVERSERDGDHSSPSSAEVKNEWSCVSIPLVCHPIVNRAALHFVEM